MITSYQQIKALTDRILIQQTDYLARRERELEKILIWHLQEINDRKLYLQMGFSSMKECMIKRYKFSQSVMYARLAVLKIMEDVPAVVDSLASGATNLTNIHAAQTFFRKQEKKRGEVISVGEKAALLEDIKDKSTREVHELFAAIDPEMSLPFDRVVPLDGKHIQLQVTLNKTFLDKIEMLKSLISHENLNPTYEELLSLALDAAIEKIEKKKGIYVRTTKKVTELACSESSSKRNSKEDSEICLESRETRVEAAADRAFNFEGLNSFPTIDERRSKVGTSLSARRETGRKKSRYISREVKRFVLKRSQHQCEFIYPDGTRCCSRFHVQFDHIVPFCRGGTGGVENIQHLCGVHNRLKGTEA